MCKLSFFLCDSMWCFEWNLCRCILLLVYICIGDTFQEGVGIPLPVYPATLCICHKQEPGFPMPYVVNIFKINYLRRRLIVPFCWYWWNWWPSLWTHGLIFPLSYRKRETMERVWENEENKRELTRTYKIMAKWENMKRQIIVNKSLHIKLKIVKHYFH